MPRDAVIEAAVRRFRPIMLTALAAILAMIPLSESVFFGPMAVAIMGGLLVATLLTLLFLPAVYAVWFKMAKGRQAFTGEVQNQRIKVVTSQGWRGNPATCAHRGTPDAAQDQPVAAAQTNVRQYRDAAHANPAYAITSVAIQQQIQI